MFSVTSDGTSSDGWPIEAMHSSTYGGWHHVALTDDGMVRKFYRDGKLVGEHENIVRNKGSEPVEFSIGRWGSCAVGARSSGMCAYSGSVAEVRWWSTARSQQDIMDKMSVCPEASSELDSIMGMWRLNENQGKVVTDSGRKGKDGDLISVST